MPTPHDVHSVAPAVSEYLPAVQLAQLADPVTEDSPAEQSSQDVRSLVETLPAAQSAHEAEPSESENVPASHVVHGVLASESRSALPTAQSVHAVAPTEEDWKKSRNVEVLDRWSEYMSTLLETDAEGNITFDELPEAFAFGMFKA